MKQPLIKVPTAYRMRSLARHAYKVGFLEGYKLGTAYIERGEKSGDGRFPIAPPEFIGREYAERAWRDGCVAGTVAATRDAQNAGDLLEEAAGIMDELDASDPVPVFVGKDLPSPSEMQNVRREAFLEAERQAKHAEQQAIIDADFAASEGRTRVGANVVAAGVLAVFVAVVVAFAFFVLQGCGKAMRERLELPRVSKN